ncbi:MAG: UvrD-helicase domain-containing protein [Bacteroidetes bacterium]|nr:UvrD-helicase domain-containing protein [Bacteroidota bacterium]
MTLKVYRSSAGSGKTFTLALEYLSLALRTPDAFVHILGVTFTNKAANEMKSRILKFLQVLSDVEHPERKLRRILVERMMAEGHGSEAEVGEKAAKVFHQILQNYGEFSVSTIDAFVYRLVRTFSRDVALPTQFELVLDSEEIVNKLIDRLFERVGTDSALTELLLRFLLENMDEQNSFDIDSLIVEFCFELLKERSLSHAPVLAAVDDATFRNLRTRLRTAYQQRLGELVSLAQQLLDRLSHFNISYDTLAKGKSGLGWQLIKLVEKQDFIDFFDKATVNDAIGPKAIVFSKANEAQQPAEIVEDLKMRFQEIGRWRDEKFSLMLVLHLLLPEMNTLMLTSHLYRETEAMIAEEQIVHISEFNKRVAGLLSNSGVPYIYERLGERYRHYLLDEFQDTSILQWSNFLPLIDNGLSGGYGSLIVGDAKQAIYRWRNGEVELFVRLPEVYPADEQPHLKAYEASLRNHYKLFDLSDNYRSCPEIIDFNNKFFNLVAGTLPEHLKPIYHNCGQNAKKSDKAGLVSISFLDENAEESLQEVILNKLITTIRKLLADGYAPNDIAILCRTNKECKLTGRFLTRQGLRIVSSESLQLNSSPKVNAVIAAMRTLLEVSDKLLVVELLAGIAANQDNHALLSDMLLPGATDEAQLEAVIGELQQQIHSHSLYSLTESLVRQLGFHQPYDPFIEALLDKVLEFQTSEAKGVSEFLRQWDEKIKSTAIVLPVNREAVSILTIHKAKGLEFPVVILPFANMTNHQKNRQRIWVNLPSDLAPPLNSALLKTVKLLEKSDFAKEYQEEQDRILLDTINLAYVAYTRAEEQLFLFFSLNNRPSENPLEVHMRNFLSKQGRWEDGITEYAFGAPTRHEPKSFGLQEVFSAGIMPVRTENQDLNYRQHSAVLATDFGNRVHKALAEVVYADDIGRVVARGAASGVFSAPEAENLLKWFDSLVRHPELNRFFSPPARVYNEASLTDGNGQLFRVDRYVELDGSRVIIEYKTGSLDKVHQEQLSKYVHYISHISQDEVQAYLVYLSSEPLVIRA